MTNNEKIRLLKTTLPKNCSKADHYQQMLERIDGIKYNYWDYMSTRLINCDEELKKVQMAGYEQCCALLTILLREDHFAQYGCFDRRYENGDVKMIIERMIFLLEKGEA